ncbi:MAG: response regulator [Acidobacteria bacterium]|nr:response regulator [Acidobacteriota bacterium]
MPSWLKHASLAAVALLVTGAVATLLMQRNTVRLDRAYTIGFNSAPPYLHKMADGKPEGLTYDIIQEAATRRGMKLRWIEYNGPPDTAILDRTVDLWPMMAISDDRRKRFHISGRWLHTYYGLLSLEQRRIAEPGDTRGKIVGHVDAPRTIALAKETFRGANRVVLETRDQVVEEVCNGTIDAGFLETRVVEPALLARPKACEGVALRMAVVNGADFPSGVAASSREAALAADAIREEVVAMARAGVLGRIFARWNLSSSADTAIIYDLIEAQNRSKQLRWFAAALCLVLAAMVLLYRKTQEARRAAERANAAKSEFLANMSHELRTPLNGIVGLTAMLTDSPIPADHQETVRDLADCSEALLAVINDILDFSKIEAGKLVVEHAPFDLHEAVRAASSTLSLRARQKGIGLTSAVDPTVPRWVTGDAARFRQLILNLLSNAVKFTPSGGVTLHVGLDPAGMIYVTVKDTGIGVDPAAMPQLFSAFTQADSSTARRFGGSGLGLAICKRVVETIGGAIGAHSEPGKGSTFWFRVPMPAASGPAPGSALAIAQDPVAAGRILLAEDNAVNRKVVDHLLRRAGYEVDTVVDGQEAFDAAKSGRYRAILMDCQMPGVDGYQATAMIREWETANCRPRVPVIALTAHAFQGDRERCLDAGMDDYLSKPVQPQVLARTLALWTARSLTVPGPEAAVRS